MRNIGRSTEFYRQLGFELVRDDGAFVELAWEGRRLFLDERPNADDPAETLAANVRVMVPDVDRYWDLALSLDARIVAPVDDREYGLRDFTVADPDGYGVRFASLL